MDNGFVMLARKFFKHTYWKQKRVFSAAEAWIDLIAMARYDKKPEIKLLENNREIAIKRGEIHASIRYLAERWSWSADRTRKFILNCINKKEINRKYVQGETVLKLCKYEIYNPTTNSDKYSGKHSDKDSNQTATSTNNKKEKKEKKRKEREEVVNDPDYEKFLLFEKWIEDNAPNVAKMKEPFTFPQYKAIRTEYAYDFIQSILFDMHNWQDLLTKRISANLTFKKWAKKN